MKLVYILFAVFIYQVHSLCVNTMQRGAQGWSLLGDLTIDQCREECGYKKYVRFSMECPKKERVSERGRSSCFCLNSLDRSYDIPEENCSGNSGASPSLGGGKNHHCDGPYTDSYGRNLGGWHRGAVYFVKGHNLCVDTRQRDAQGWRNIGLITIDDCRRECNHYGYDKFSMECPTVETADNTAYCYCLNYLSLKYNLPDENCFGNADATPELGGGKNHHCTGPYTDCHGRSLGGWHRGAVYNTKQCAF